MASDSTYFTSGLGQYRCKIKTSPLARKNYRAAPPYLHSTPFSVDSSSLPAASASCGLLLNSHGQRLEPSNQLRRRADPEANHDPSGQGRRIGGGNDSWCCYGRRICSELELIWLVAATCFLRRAAAQGEGAAPPAAG